MSSLGTFQLNDLSEVGEVSFDDAGQISDFVALHSVISSLVNKLYGSSILSDIPDDFGGFLDDLLHYVKDPKVDSYIIENHPAFLPATTYGLGFLKMHGVFMEEGCGLLYTESSDTYLLLSHAPYQSSSPDWVQLVQNDKWLSKWMKGRTFNAKNQRHVLIFPRNLFSHCLAHRHHTALTSPTHPAKPGQIEPDNPAPLTPYPPEAVSILFQHVLPRLLPFLVKVAYEYSVKKGRYEEIKRWRFNELFRGVKPCYLR